MHRSVRLGLLLSVLLLAAPAFGREAPALKAVSRQPLIVQGASFKSGESVVVTVTLPDRPRMSRQAAVGHSGSFRVTFTGLVLDRCSRPVVRAVGNNGSSATLKVTPRLACMPA
jgi:hypothetical protein